VFEGFARVTSEDCLTLNVWVPTTAGDANLPVLVWIHGGAFYQGSGGDDFNDGARLAARAGAIVVTINYRLGPLGFLSHRALAREEGRRASPSFGLLDQRAALQWVQRNIAAFGGDPARVTVAGQSAGAWSVCAQLTSPGSRGLFTRAIMESGACSDALYFQPAKAEQQGDALAAAVGCTGAGVLECLRARSPDELVAALPHKRALILHPGVWWGPVIDGVELPEVPLDAMRTGAFARVPLLIGWNRDEGTVHTVSLGAVSATDVADFVDDSFGEAAVNPVSARYVRSTAKLALTDIVTDGVFAFGARRVARAFAARAIPTFLYLWTRALDAPSHHALGATHGVELFFLWGNAANGINLSKREEVLSETLMRTWGRFARTGDPSGDGLHWPRTSPDGDVFLTLDLEQAVGAGLKRDECNFWDTLER
jgi:para-nitrobenzyl esterase